MEILKKNPKKVILIEKDTKLANMLIKKFTDNVNVINQDVLKLNERELNYISNADIIAVPNLIHFFDKDKLNIFKSLMVTYMVSGPQNQHRLNLQRLLNVNGRVCWPPDRRPYSVLNKRYMGASHLLQKK